MWRAGRWTWDAAIEGATKRECPACRRIREATPAGTLVFDGLAGARKRELIAMARNIEAAEKAVHPLERIMAITDDASGVSITTTGVHVTRRIAEAVQRTWHARVEIRYGGPRGPVRVRWKSPSRTESRARGERATGGRRGR